MDMNRRAIFGAAGLAGAALAMSPVQAAVSGGMLNAREFGVEPNAARDQSRALQTALDEASRRGGHLLLEPGLYIASALRITSSLNLLGASSQTRLVQAGPEPVLTIEGASGVRLEGLVIDGQLRPSSSALVEARSVRDLAVANCLIANSGNNGINLTNAPAA